MHHQFAWISLISSNDRLFGCPIICTDTLSKCHFVHWQLIDNAWYNKVHWLIGTPYLSMIASRDVLLCYSKEIYLCHFCDLTDACPDTRRLSSPPNASKKRRIIVLVVFLAFAYSSFLLFQKNVKDFIFGAPLGKNIYTRSGTQMKLKSISEKTTTEDNESFQWGLQWQSARHKRREGWRGNVPYSFILLFLGRIHSSHKHHLW